MDRHDALMNRLEVALKRLGLTSFSSKIAVSFLKKHLSDVDGQVRLKHVISYLLNELNNTTNLCAKATIPTVTTTDDASIDWQYGCPNRIEGLRGLPFWDVQSFPWIDQFVDCSYDIKQELLMLRGTNDTELMFQPYRSPPSSSSSSSSSSSNISTGSSDSTTASKKDTVHVNEIDGLGQLATDVGKWNVCYLYLHGIDFKDNMSKCPKTVQAIQLIPRLYNHVFFSVLTSNGHITPHFGPTNKKLRLHLPLVVPIDAKSGKSLSWLRVGSEKVYLQEGVPIIFDDSFQHEASNESTDGSTRIVLVIDVWHPDLSDIEVKFFQFLNNAQITAAKRMNKFKDGTALDSEADTNADTDADTDIDGVTPSKQSMSSNENFLSVILNARNINVPSEEIWGVKVIDD